MRWLARWARRMADVIDPPVAPGRHATPLAGVQPYCVFCETNHAPPLHLPRM